MLKQRACKLMLGPDPRAAIPGFLSAAQSGRPFICSLRPFKGAGPFVRVDGRSARTECDYATYMPATVERAMTSFTSTQASSFRPCSPPEQSRTCWKRPSAISERIKNAFDGSSRSG